MHVYYDYTRFLRHATDKNNAQKDSFYFSMMEKYCSENIPLIISGVDFFIIFAVLFFYPLSTTKFVE